MFNYEGILIHNHQKGYNADLYIQIFRNGVIEVYTSYLHKVEKKIIYRNAFEKELIENIPKYLSVIRFFELDIPVLIYLTVLDIKGYTIGLFEGEHMRRMQQSHFCSK